MKRNNIFKVIILCLMLVCLASCGEEKVEVHIHEWSSWETLKNATCSEEGLKSRHCLGCEKTDDIVLNLAAHSFDNGKIITEASCETAGVIEFTCSNCDKVVKQEIPILEHSVELISGKAATCYNDGLTDGEKCKVCDKVLKEQQVIKALGHAWEELIVTTKATCSSEGKAQSTCSICKSTKTFVVDKLVHNIEYINRMDPDCINKGSTGNGYCLDCKEIVKKTSDLLPLGHNYVNGKCVRCHDQESKDGMKFKLVNGKYYLADAGSKVTSVFTVPLMYNNEYVVGILDGAFDKAIVTHIIQITSIVTDIEVGAFDNCEFLFDIVIEEDNPAYYVKNSCLIEKGTNVLIAGAADGNIPEGVVKIEKGAFRNRIGLVDINLPKSVKEIGEGAFNGCGNIMTITVDPLNEVYYSQDDCLLLKENNLLLLGCQSSIISEGIEVIGPGAFDNCSELTEIKLPSTLTTIMPGAFTNCPLVTSLYISSNVTELTGAFEGMISLSNISVSENNPKYTVVDGCLVEKKTNRLVLADKRGIIPEGIEIIGYGAFAGNEGIFKLELPESVKVIEERAFANCINLEEVVFNKNVTSIPDSCFEGCEYLEFIEIPRHITSIGKKAFKGCVRFERLEIRNTMKYVGEDAFDECIRLYIVCEAKEQPDTWDKNWNPDNRDVLWGHYVVD